MGQMTRGRGWFTAAALMLASGLLGGCVSDESASKLLVAPGGFDLYSCPQLQRSADTLRARRLELEGLMAKAGTDSAGRMVGEMAYRPDYLNVRGQLDSLEVTARQKQCDITPKPPKPAAGRTAPRPKPR